jgi:putative ABC transport system permease protein
MFTNYLKVALRNLLRQKTYSLINITGLAVGIACCIAIMLYVQDELSYDKFNRYADRVYRPVLHGLINNQEINSPQCPAPMGPALVRDLPDVAEYTRIRDFRAPVIKYGDKVFSETKFYWVDSTFFRVFTVRFLEGNPQTALTQPNTVVITKATARKYFGDEDAMGKILNADNNRDYVVTGIVEGFPHNSHFHFDFLGSLCTYEDSRNPFWLSFNYYTYALLREGTDPVKFQKELNDEFRRNASPQLQQSIGVSLDQFEAAGNRFGFSLQPMTSIRLHSHLSSELEVNGDISYVYIFSAIAVAILLIACINFINLETARSERRAKEVGIRKTLGSNRLQLVRQFMTESILMTAFAVMIAVGLLELLFPFFNGIAGKEMNLSLFGDPSLIPFLICLTMFIGLVAGSYPALRLSSYDAVQALRSEMIIAERKSFLRSGLVVFQFAISIILFVATVVIYSQLKYVQDKDLGFNKEQVIVINKTDHLGKGVGPFERDLLDNATVIAVSNSTAIPGNQQGSAAFWVKGATSQQVQAMSFMYSDYDFQKTYQLKLLSGRFLSKDHPSDTSAVVVNQAAEKVFGVKDLVGKYLVTPGRSKAGGQTYEVVGVIRDFNYESLHEFVQPLVMGFVPSEQTGQFVSVRVAPGDYASTLSFLESRWNKYAGSEAFNYDFLDQNLAHLYAAEQSTGKIVTTFSVVAIFVACLGLLGLAAFVTERRTKEIGVRKVLGASVAEVVYLLSMEFTKWVLIANVAAWPLAYYIMNHWLTHFAYRIDMTVWPFLLGGIAALAIAIVTVGWQAVRAATANPVESLRYE